ncbi:MAG: PAS domain S-box protein [Rudaea sp.]
MKQSMHLDVIASNSDDQTMLFEHNPVAMWVYDAQTLRILAVNESAIRAYGYTRSAFLDMRIGDLDACDDEHRDADAETQRPPATGEVNIRRHWTAQGRALIVELAIQDIRFAGRDAHLVVARDVTAQRRAIGMVEASERRFRDFFELSMGLICTHDMDGILLSVNPAAAAALGYGIHDLLGRPMIEMVPPNLQARFGEYLERINRSGEDKGLLQINHRDGSPRIWQYHNRVHRERQSEAYVIGHAQDITERRLNERLLLEQQAEINAVHDCSPLGLFRASLDGQFTYINRSFERIAQQRTDEAIGMGWTMALHPQDRERVVGAWTAAVATRKNFLSTHRLVHASGRTAWVSVGATPLIVEGEIVGYVGSVSDVTAQHIAEQQLRRSELRLRTLADAIPAQIGYVDKSQRLEFANAAFERASGIDRTRLVGRTVRDVLGDDAYARRIPYLARVVEGEAVTFEDECRNGSDYRCVEINYLPQRDEENNAVVGFHFMTQDITYKKLQERHLIQAAECDSMTGLTNRRGFMDRLDRALARSCDQQSMLAVMYLDIDHFKHINDTHGHAVGDAILKTFAERLSAALRPSNIIGRLGGDEFAVIIEGVRRPQYASAAAAKIVIAMRRPIVLEQEQVTLSITSSVGVTLSANESGMTPALLLDRADKALYEAKAAGRNCYRVSPMVSCTAGIDREAEHQDVA